MQPHLVINPYGTEISVPKWVLIRLRAFKLLEWNREARRHQVSPRYFAMREVIEGYSKPRRSAPARDYSQIRTKHQGRVSTLYKILGPDCSGPPNEMECTCRDCLDRIPVIRGEGLKRR
jgi:hypothetical protein